MYIPSSFDETDQQRQHSFIEAHSFGLLVTQADDESIASHLPFLLDRDSGAHGRLVSHMARANTQWNDADDTDVLVVFHGPHTYISPSWYSAANVVPTWNYVAVHAYGRMRLIQDDDRLLDLLRQTVHTYESNRSAPWSMDEPEPEFVNGLLKAIVGFEIDITRIEGKWKLSQNHDRERRKRVIRELAEAGDEQSQQIAMLMSQTLTD